MGSPIYSPDDPSLYSDADSPLLNLYQQLRQDPTVAINTNYVDPNSPEYKNYINLTSSPTGSSDLINQYINRKPTREQFDPSFGRRMAAFAVGMLSGPHAGYEMAQNVLNDPYNKAVKDWKDEGADISTRARLLDAERQRQITAAKYGLQQEASNARNEALNATRTNRQAEVLAAKEEARKRQEALDNDRAEQQTINNDFRNKFLDLASEREQDAKSRIADANTAREEAAKRRLEAENSPEAINKNIAARASQAGMANTHQYSAQDMAVYMAKKQAMQHPAFQDMMDPDTLALKNPTNDMDKASFEARKPILQKYLNMLVQRYLKGSFD